MIVPRLASAASYRRRRYSPRASSSAPCSLAKRSSSCVGPDGSPPGTMPPSTGSHLAVITDPSFARAVSRQDAGPFRPSPGAPSDAALGNVSGPSAIEPCEPDGVERVPQIVLVRDFDPVDAGVAMQFLRPISRRLPFRHGEAGI